MIAFVVAQFYSFPFMTLEFYGTRLLNACIVITCKLLLPVFFSWAIFNYSRHSTEQVFDELWLRSLYDKLLRVQIVRRKSTNDNRRCDYMMISQTGFDKPNAPNIALPPVETRTAVTLPCDVDMSNAEISGSGITAIKYIFLVYSRLAYSLYLSHHFYLSLSLYQVRRPLGTTTFDVVSTIEL